MNPESRRLLDNLSKQVPLELWGPYVSERQWGTVREDYGEWGDAWGYFPFDHSHFRAYRWGEDGIAGISDYFQNLCFAIALWNGKDGILKERLFGLGNYKGNHGEDVKELYYHLDNIPSHYYMEYLYKYPQEAFPYDELIRENGLRSRQEPEFEILDTGAFDKNAYFDVHVTYAKAASDDICIRVDIVNRGEESAEITILPTLWFYNRWQYDEQHPMPSIRVIDKNSVLASHHRLGNYRLYFDTPDDLLFTDNETNRHRLDGTSPRESFTKDAFHRVIVDGEPARKYRKRGAGTKCAPVYRRTIPCGGKTSIHLRLSANPHENALEGSHADTIRIRQMEADEFYAHIVTGHASDEYRHIQKMAFSGLLWSKQFYHYDVDRWLKKSDGITPWSEKRLHGRNHDWHHLKNQDVISMPDKWEFPWYAAWDLAFQCIPLAHMDPTFAKNQLLLVMREWYMKPDGQLPAYEWHFSDVNPPIQAWAALEVYQIEKERTGQGDIIFLKKIFQKLLINFTWWVNRKDPNGNNLFEGGFLGLDNIGIFNRSQQLPDQVSLEQADGTAWMGMYALNMLDMALEIAIHDVSFEDTATKFFEQYVLIAEALNSHGMWNEEDGFYYDTLSIRDSQPIQLKVQSVVGLTSLFAVSIIRKKVMEKLTDFRKRTSWFERYRIRNGLFWPNEQHGEKDEVLHSLVPRERLLLLLDRLLNEDEFLSEYGIRALSRRYQEHPFTMNIHGKDYTIAYEPGDSTSDFFGGNSNWRGPVWLPMNYLIIRSIRKFGEFYGDSLKVECPRGSGQWMDLKGVADELSRRIIRLFERDAQGRRPVFGEYQEFYNRPGNEKLLLFHEYFHGDDGKGLGASHQTGWTALVADLIHRLGR
jgi:hypothetical protein